MIRKKIINLSTKFMMRQTGVPTKMKRERGDHLLEVLGTIIIAVVLLVIFRDSIKNIFNTAMDATSNNINNLF